MIMRAIELLGMISIVGLLFTAEMNNHGVSKFINTLGAANRTIVQGVGPGPGWNA